MLCYSLFSLFLLLLYNYSLHKKMSAWESQLSSQEYKYFTQLFQFVSKQQEGIVTGAEAVRFFATSGVPNQILSEVSFLSIDCRARHSKLTLAATVDLGSC